MSAGAQVAGPERLDWVDAAKGLGMLAVVFGHIPSFGMPAVVEFLYLFHMPMFFVLAGMFQAQARPEEGFEAFVKRKARQRLVPYLGFAAVSVLMFCWLTARLTPAVELAHSPASVVQSILLGRPAINVALWFFPCLFCAELLAYPFLRWRPAHGAWAAVGVAVVLSLPWIDLNDLPGVFKLGVAVVAFPLLLLGFHARAALRALARRSAAVWVIVGGFAFALTWCAAPWVGRINMMSGTYQDLGWFYVCGLSGTLMVICLGCLLRRVRLLRTIGATTGIIFPLHLLFRPFIAVDVGLVLDEAPLATADGLLLGLVYLVLMIGFPLGVMRLAATMATRTRRKARPAPQLCPVRR